jgi:hypothetical protein
METASAILAGSKYSNLGNLTAILPPWVEDLKMTCLLPLGVVSDLLLVIRV